MLNRQTLLAAFVGVAFLLGWSGRAAFAQDTGTITGTVTDEAGTPQPGIKVFLMAPAVVEGGGIGPKGGGAPNSFFGLGDIQFLQAKGTRKVAETVTAPSGTFTFANVKPGAYIVMVGKMQGGGRFPVRVNAGQTVNIAAKCTAAQLR